MSNQSHPNNHLAEAILVTLFCCLPFGIIAIFQAASVNSKLACGDREGAIAASESAATWCAIGFWSGLIVMVLYFVAAAG